jgi:ATPase subunit of ABC transporter with duplicated ATPase domains
MQNQSVGRNTRSIRIQFERDQDAFSLAFGRLSEGEKCFFAGSLLLAANEYYGPLLCFWDEPDNYLSLPEVRHFVAGLRKSMRNGGQLLATSHNPEAIGSFSCENTLLLYRNGWFEPSRTRWVEGLDVGGDLIAALIRDDLEFRHEGP